MEQWKLQMGTRHFKWLYNRDVDSFELIQPNKWLRSWNGLIMLGWSDSRLQRFYNRFATKTTDNLTEGASKLYLQMQEQERNITRRYS